VRRGKDQNFYLFIPFMQLEGALRAVPEGVTIRIEVAPSSRNSGIEGFNAWRHAVRIKLTEPAQKGKANEQLMRYLAILFDKPVDEVQLISGHTSTRKVVLLCNTVVDEVESVINAAVPK